MLFFLGFRIWFCQRNPFILELINFVYFISWPRLLLTTYFPVLADTIWDIRGRKFTTTIIAVKPEGVIVQ